MQARDTTSSPQFPDTFSMQACATTSFMLFPDTFSIQASPTTSSTLVPGTFSTQAHDTTSFMQARATTSSNLAPGTSSTQARGTTSSMLAPGMSSSTLSPAMSSRLSPATSSRLAPGTSFSMLAPEVDPGDASDEDETVAVDDQNMPGYQHVDRLAEYLVGLQDQTSFCLTNLHASQIMELWENLDERDKQCVVYAARHQDRLLSGRFRTPKRPSKTPGVAQQAEEAGAVCVAARHCFTSCSLGVGGASSGGKSTPG